MPTKESTRRPLKDAVAEARELLGRGWRIETYIDPLRNQERAWINTPTGQAHNTTLAVFRALEPELVEVRKTGDWITTYELREGAAPTPTQAASEPSPFDWSRLP